MSKVFKMDLKLGSLAMSYLVTEEKVRREAEEAAGVREETPVYCDSGIRLSSVYYKFRKYDSLSHYVDDMASYVREARGEGAQVLVFPQHMGVLPITFMPGFKKIEEDIMSMIEGDNEKNASLFRSFAESTQGFLGEIFFNTFATLARCFKMIIAVGGFYRVSDGRIYNTSYIFSEKGQVIGTEDKLFLSKREENWGVSAGEEIVPAHSYLGKLALLTTGSVNRYEPFFIANAMGASLCLVPGSPLDTENLTLIHRSNENRQCIVSSGFDSTSLGKVLGAKEKSLISVPYNLSLKKDGILRMGDKKVNTCLINMNRLKEAFDPYSSDSNSEFLREMMKI